MAYAKFVLLPALILFMASSYLSAVTILLNGQLTQKMTVNVAFTLFVVGMALVVIWGLLNTSSLNPYLED